MDVKAFCGKNVNFNKEKVREEGRKGGGVEMRMEKV